MEEKPPEGENKSKRKMKTASQLELLEKTYAVGAYPSESIRAELSEQLGLSDRQLQMWFCHRRLKDRKNPPLQQVVIDAEVAAFSSGGAEAAADELGNEKCHYKHREMNTSNISANFPILKRHYELPQGVLELQAIAFVESQLGEPLREDGPILGLEFDPLPPGAFGAPIVTVGQPKPAARSYEFNLYERPVAKPMKGTARALHEYQFLPEQPSARDDTHKRGAPSHYFGSPPNIPISKVALPTGPSGYGFQGQKPGLSHLPHQARADHLLPSTSGDYDIFPKKNSNISTDAYVIAQPLNGLESQMVTSERVASHDEDIARMEKKRKSDEARIAREVEAHEKRIRKELEKQDILRHKREEQMKKEMERQDRERRKEEERLLREKQREEERYQREQRREMERREKFMQKESMRAEKIRLKEEQRKEKEAARQKAANDRATARRIAKESAELIEDERLELMELAAANKGYPSIVSLNSEDLYNLDLYKHKVVDFPPKSVNLKRPFAIKPWIDSEETVGNLLMVWRFLITFADLLTLWPFTLDEFIQAFHDYDSRLLGEIHIALIRTIIKDIEDVARMPSSGLGATQSNVVSLGGGHPQIVEGGYAWGFDIRSWQRHLNPLTWPEILRQFAISAGFGPKLRKKNIEPTHLRDENEDNDGEGIVSDLRSGAAAKNAVSIMQERGYSNPRRSRHRLTPGTVKYAAFHVLSLEGSDGLTILQVAEKIQKSGLRDLTTSKTPEASIAAALSRDTKLFERTAPSTYCVRTPYRKDPVSTEVILNSARETIKIFMNGLINEEEAEDAEHDDAERDEDSESDAEHDDAERDEDSESDAAEDPEPKLENKDVSNDTDIIVAKTLPVDGENPSRKDIMKMPQISQKNSSEIAPLLHSEGLEARSSGCTTIIDMEYMIVEDSNSCESWVQGLMEGEYSDLSVEERLNALVALIGIANEGNSVRVVLEERMEAANVLKKQMWADAQLDKRRMKEEYVTKTMQYTPSANYRTEINGRISLAESGHSPFPAVDNKIEQTDLNYPGLVVAEGNPEVQELFAEPDNISFLPSGYGAERSRSQLKAYVGQKAEEMYVYRSLPLGQDRRRNRYWQFTTSASQNDPGSGRIFVELQNGFWTLIDTEEGFDSLVASLDPRGLRESHLHSMLQKIDVSFKECLRKNLAHRRSAGVTIDNVKTENVELSSKPDRNSVCAFNSIILETSSSFVAGIGRSEAERNDLLGRYQDFEKWMWKECLNSSLLCAMKYRNNRCKELLATCDNCRDFYFIEDPCCPSCHRIYKTYPEKSRFSENVPQSQEEFKGHAENWPLRTRLLKGLFAVMEVSIPEEALLPAWSDELRKYVVVILHAASSAEDVLQILTSLEGSIKKDFLSLDFERTAELLGSCNQPGSAANISTVSVLPWIPKTTSAVALRLMELDSSISFTPNEKVDLKKDQAVGNLITSPQSFPEEILAEAPYEAETMQPDPWLDSPNLHSGSGKRLGTRGRPRGRPRGGRPPKNALGSRERESAGKEGLVQLIGWKGRGGRKRGRPSLRSGEKPMKREKVAEIGNGGDQSEQSLFEINLRKLVAVSQWGRETMDMDRAEDNDSSSSESERSEYDDYNNNNNGQETGAEYDDFSMGDYNDVFNDKSDHLMEGINYSLGGVEDEDDQTGELENEIDDEEEYIDVGGFINGDSDEEGDGVGKQICNPDITESSSSEYSD